MKNSYTEVAPYTVATTVEARPSAPSESDGGGPLTKKLKELQETMSSGLITQEEYDASRQNIMENFIGASGGTLPTGGTAPTKKSQIRIDTVWVGKNAKSFKTGQSEHNIAETFRFSVEGNTYVTTGSHSGRNTYSLSSDGKTLNHHHHGNISATLQSNRDLQWSHGYTSRITGDDNTYNTANTSNESTNNGNMSAFKTNGCYIGACFIIPCIVTCFRVDATDNDHFVANGCSLLGIPLPWTHHGSRRGPQRFHLDNDQDLYWHSSGGCFWGSPGWWALRVC